MFQHKDGGSCSLGPHGTLDSLKGAGHGLPLESATEPPWEGTGGPHLSALDQSHRESPLLQDLESLPEQPQGWGQVCQG